MFSASSGISQRFTGPLRAVWPLALGRADSRPPDPITRQEAAVMAVKAAQLSGRAGQGEFTEPADGDQIALWAQEGVMQALSLDLMELRGGASARWTP